MSAIPTVTVLTISAALVMGLVLGLAGQLKQALASRLDVGRGRVAWLLGVLNLSVVGMTMLSGLLIDVWAVRPVVVLGSVLLCLGLVGLGTRTGTRAAVGAVFVAGLGASALGCATVVLMPRAFFGVRETAASLQAGTVFVALGALAAAALTDVLLHTAHPRRALLLLALLALAPAFLALVTRGDQLEVEHAPVRLAGLLGEPALWAAGLAMLLYVPLEGAVGHWAVALADPREGPRRAVGLAASFWAAFLLSRLGVALVLHGGSLGDDWDGWVLLLPLLLGAVLLGNLAGTAEHRSARWALMGLGLLLGPFLPTLLALVLVRLEPGREAPGTVYGLLFAAGSLGSLLLGPLLGGRRPGERAAFRVPMLLGLLLTAVSLVFLLLASRSG